jgi:hypothetical protein
MKDLNCKVCSEVTSCSEEAIAVTCCSCVTDILCNNIELTEMDLD